MTVEYEDIYKSKRVLQEHEGIVYRELTQPSEDLILEHNAELRKNPGIVRDLGKGTQTWGRLAANIPMIVFNKAIRDGYQLNAKDSDFAGRELHRFLQSEEGKKCLIR